MCVLLDIHIHFATLQSSQKLVAAVFVVWVFYFCMYSYNNKVFLRE